MGKGWLEIEKSRPVRIDVHPDNRKCREDSDTKPEAPPKIKWAPTITCGRGPCVGSAREHLFPIVDVDKYAADAGVESVA